MNNLPPPKVLVISSANIVTVLANNNGLERACQMLADNMNLLTDTRGDGTDKLESLGVRYYLAPAYFQKTGNLHCRIKQLKRASLKVFTLAAFIYERNYDFVLCPDEQIAPFARLATQIAGAIFLTASPTTNQFVSAINNLRTIGVSGQSKTDNINGFLLRCIVNIPSIALAVM